MKKLKPAHSLLFGALLLLLTGCENASHSTAVSGGDLSVTPVTYTYTVTIKNAKAAQARTELFNYLQNNKKTLLVYGAKITWTNKQTRSLAERAAKWLISAGTPTDLVKLVNASDNQKPNAVSVATTLYQVQTRLCELRKIEQYHSGDDGCHADNLRWHAMLHPNKKIAGYSNITTDMTGNQ